jgi:predicted dithiol-disulfide oxidoreductase (DUF899 family)
MGWSFPWASSSQSDFNYDFQTSHTESEQQSGALDYNYQTMDLRPMLECGGAGSWVAQLAPNTGIDAATYMKEMPGMSAFVLEDGVVYHTYSTYARGLDALWGMYQWLDRAPLGRNEDEWWFRRHDEYAVEANVADRRAASVATG